MSHPNPIYQLFGKSPIGPLQTHMSKATACAEGLLPFFAAVVAEDWVEAEQQLNHIAKLESEADDIKKDVRLTLPRSMFLPANRADILELLILQDKVANRAEDIAGLVFGRKMTFPPAIVAPYEAFLSRAVTTASHANKAVNELQQLLEAGFRGNEAKIVRNMIVQLENIESETDVLQIAVRKALFEIERDWQPVDVMFLYKIIDWTANLSDRAQQAGSQLELLLAK